MLIVLAKPIPFSLHTALAVSTNTWESIVIRKIRDNVFQLALFKHFDLTNEKDESQSAKWYPMAVLDTYEKCEKLFKIIVDAIEADQKVFRVSDYLDEINLENNNDLNNDVALQTIRGIYEE